MKQGSCKHEKGSERDGGHRQMFQSISVFAFLSQTHEIDNSTKNDSWCINGCLRRDPSWHDVAEFSELVAQAHAAAAAQDALEEAAAEAAQAAYTAKAAMGK